jgi:hypothetical protein
MSVTRSFTRVAFLITASLLVWLACFAAIYVLGAIACVRGFTHVRLAGVALPAATSILLLLAATGFTICQIRQALRQRRRGDQNAKFAGFLALSLGTLALMGLGLLAVPALLLHPACSGQPELVTGMHHDARARA